MSKVMSSFLRKIPFLPALYCDGFMEYTYNGDHSICSFFINKFKFINFYKLVWSKKVCFSPKQGLAIALKAFLWSPNEIVHSKLYTYPPTLTAVFMRLCEGIGPILRKDDSCDIPLTIYHKLFMYEYTRKIENLVTL